MFKYLIKFYVLWLCVFQTISKSVHHDGYHRPKKPCQRCVRLSQNLKISSSTLLKFSIEDLSRTHKLCSNIWLNSTFYDFVSSKQSDYSTYTTYGYHHTRSLPEHQRRLIHSFLLFWFLIFLSKVTSDPLKIDALKVQCINSTINKINCDKIWKFMDFHFATGKHI